MKNYFATYFNVRKSPNAFNSDKYKYRGRIVWDSQRLGTYVRAKHGELK
jgi:hypothetical protein